jgi:hypothetical protein
VAPPDLVECDLVPVVVFDFADAESLPDVRFSLVYTAEESPCQWPTEATSDRSGRIMVCPKHLPRRLGHERVLAGEFLPVLAAVGAAIGAEEPTWPPYAFPGEAMKISTAGMERPWAPSISWT